MTVIEPPKERDPRCRGKCGGERAAWESPAVMYKGRPACPCCGYYLVRANTEELGRAPNLIPEVVDNSIRYEDNICRYDHVYLKEIIEKR